MATTGFTKFRSGILTGIERTLHAIFPPACIACGEEISTLHGLCPSCWPEVGFITGAACDCCGTPLPGGTEDQSLLCDDCLSDRPNWHKGRAAITYAGVGRKLVLGFKHGDRLDLRGPLASWMRQAGRDLITADTVIAPIPLHPKRLFKRLYNQSATLAEAIARTEGMTHLPTLFHRSRETRVQDGMTREERFANMAGAIAIHPKQAARIAGRKLLIVDDVMTSGATLRAATEAAKAAGAAEVNILVLARVAKDA